MKVTQAEFVISAISPSQYPDDALPEVALAGRSNVGKSSLINRMINRKNLARTSSQPGKTQTLNYYRINRDLYFVDVPGYGFAKVSRSVQQKWGKMVEEYLRSRKELKLVLLVVDIRHPPTKDDKAMFEWLHYYRIPCCVVATKADKISRGRWQQHLEQVKRVLECPPAVPVVLFSAETGQGKEELWTIVEKYIG